MEQRNIAIFLADGFEEVEALTPADYLRRSGVVVSIVGVGSDCPQGSHGVRLCADITMAELPDRLDGVVLPGGMPGAENLAASAELRRIVRGVMATGGLVAAICAAPALVLESFDVLGDRDFTCYPGFENGVSTGRFRADPVVVDGNLITSRGPGTAGVFSMALIRYLLGDEAAADVARAVLLQTPFGVSA